MRKAPARQPITRQAPGPAVAPAATEAKNQLPALEAPGPEPIRTPALKTSLQPPRTLQPTRVVQPRRRDKPAAVAKQAPPRPEQAQAEVATQKPQTKPASSDTRGPLPVLQRPTPEPRPVAKTEPPPAPRKPAGPPPPEARNTTGFARAFTKQNRLDPARAPSKAASQTVATGATVPLPKPFQPVRALPTDLTPLPKDKPRYRSPDFYRGIYINNAVARDTGRFAAYVRQAKANGLNTLVVDVQPRMPSSRSMRLAREAGLYLVARVVVFEYGLKVYPPPLPHLEKVVHAAERAAIGGFMEIQLDYIRFADRSKKLGVPLADRYRTIASFLKLFSERLRPHGVRIGADVFGRIAFNRNDIIGQKLEIFAPHLDTIYPMLYPSHFYGDPKYQRDPYRAIYDGNRSSLRRVGHQSKIVAYIQGFDMKVKLSGLSYVNYIQRQIKAAEDSKSQGFIVWNAHNRYAPFYRALRRHRKLP